VLVDESLQRQKHCQMPINQIAEKKILQLKKIVGHPAEPGPRGGHGRDFGVSLILPDPPKSWVRTGLAGAWAPARCGAARRDTVRLE